MTPAQRLYRELDAERARGALSAEFFMKCCVTLASDEAREGRLDAATAMLARCNEQYLRAVLPQQAAEDPGFRVAVYALADALVDAGLAVPGAVAATAPAGGLPS